MLTIFHVRRAFYSSTLNVSKHFDHGIIHASMFLINILVTMTEYTVTVQHATYTYILFVPECHISPVMLQYQEYVVSLSL